MTRTHPIRWLLRALSPVVPRRYVVVHGFYGTGNVGDEAILTATLEAVRRVTDLEPFVFAWYPERVTADFGVQSLNPNRANRLEVARVLLRAEAYLLGGGGLLKDYGGDSRSLSRWLDCLELARALGARTMLWSVGVENVLYDASRARLRQALSAANVITVRDEASAERLREVGVVRPIVVTADPVPHLARAYVEARGRERSGGEVRRIVVCLRHWFAFANTVPDARAFDGMLTALAEGLDSVAERYGSEIAFLPFRTAQGDDDRVVCRAVAERMRGSRHATISEDALTVEEALRKIAEADLVVAMRLHAVVMATAMGIPAVAISYMPKVADYMASIDQSGYCTSVEDVSAEWLAARVEEAVGEYDALSHRLRSATERASERFSENERLLAELLTPDPGRLP